MLVNNLPRKYFFLKFDFQMIDLVIQEKYFKANFLNKTLDFHYYTPLSAHNWNPNFRFLGGLYSNDSNSLDFCQRNSKFVFIFKLEMFTFEKFRPTSKNSLPFKSFCRNGDRNSLFNTFPMQLTLVNRLPLTYFLPKI